MSHTIDSPAPLRPQLFNSIMKSRALTLIASESKLRDSDIWQLRVSARCVTVGKFRDKDGSRFMYTI